MRSRRQSPLEFGAPDGPPSSRRPTAFVAQRVRNQGRLRWIRPPPWRAAAATADGPRLGVCFDVKVDPDVPAWTGPQWTSKTRPYKGTRRYIQVLVNRRVPDGHRDCFGEPPEGL